MRTLSCLILLSLIAAPARSTDGVLEINQTCAVLTGCFPGDAAGFPVTIDGASGRSHRLTSDLVVPDPSTHGIEVAAPSVSLDLNGFEIVGLACGGATTNCTPTSGSGVGVVAVPSSIGDTSVRNGSIVGMGDRGLLLGPRSEVRSLRVRWNRGSGIDVGPDSVVAVNASSENGGAGITAGARSSVQRNTANGNGGFGLDLDPAASFAGNTVDANGAGSVSAGVNAGGNACDGTPMCPSQLCGNATIDLGELCDGFSLAGETCASQGFVAGTLICAADCSSYDTAACTSAPACGNGVQEAGEVCDGTDLAGISCNDFGFSSGLLICEAGCGGWVLSNCVP